MANNTNPTLFLLRRGARWALTFGTIVPEGDVRASWALGSRRIGAIAAVGTYRTSRQVEEALAPHGLRFA